MKFVNDLLRKLYYLTHGHIVYNGVQYNLNYTNDYLEYMEVRRKEKDDVLKYVSSNTYTETENFYKRECLRLRNKYEPAVCKNTFVDTLLDAVEPVNVDSQALLVEKAE